MNEIREKIPRHILKKLDRMADEQFMKPEIGYGDCLEIETNRGESYIVPDWVHAPKIDDYDADEITDPEFLEQFEMYMPEGICGKPKSARVHLNIYCARLTAPGYLDCTDWAMFDTAREAAEYLLST